MVGLHLEVVDDKPELPSGAKPPCHFDSWGGGTLEALSKDVAAFSDVDRVSEAASSSSKVCRALLLTHSRVRVAVTAAGGGGAGGD